MFITYYASRREVSISVEGVLSTMQDVAGLARFAKTVLWPSAETVVFDLAACSWFDSRAIGQLMDGQRELEALGCRIELINVDQGSAALLSSCNVDRLIPVAERV